MSIKDSPGLIVITAISIIFILRAMIHWREVIPKLQNSSVGSNSLQTFFIYLDVLIIFFTICIWIGYATHLFGVKDPAGLFIITIITLIFIISAVNWIRDSFSKFIKFKEATNHSNPFYIFFIFIDTFFICVSLYFWGGYTFNLW